MTDFGYVLGTAFGHDGEHPMYVEMRERAGKLEKLLVDDIEHRRPGGHVVRKGTTYDLIIPKESIRKYESEEERKKVTDNLKAQGRL